MTYSRGGTLSAYSAEQFMPNIPEMNTGSNQPLQGLIDQLFEKNAFLGDINDLDDDEIEVVEEENNQNITKTIFCRAIRMVHESQLPKSDGENYFLDRMSPNEIYLLRYSEIKWNLYNFIINKTQFRNDCQ
nr:15019_t:CDS:2 [Entrophospora candida]